MSKALSVDLRERVLAAVAAGASHRQAGERFGVSAASVSRWRALAREQGNAKPKALGGDRRSGRIEAQRELILGLLENRPDQTIEELRCALAEHGHQFATITTDVKTVPPARVNLTFVIKEGPTVKVGHVQFEGNNSVSSRTLRARRSRAVASSEMPVTLAIVALPRRARSVRKLVAMSGR